jgi:hypothetical protein
MTPNGAIVFGLLLIAGTLMARDLAALAVVFAVLIAFSVSGRRNIASALLWSGAIVLPLAAFMALVWIGIVGRAPHEIAAGSEGSRAAAAIYVGLICARLFIMAFATQAILLRFSDRTPLVFVRALAAPPMAKKLLVLTLSLVETMLHAVDRARTALIAGGIITRRASWRNLKSGWLLVQAVWLTAIAIVIGRTRDKWPTENTLARLESALVAPDGRRFAPADALWSAAAFAALALAIGLR